jgi:hypothetical protein
MATLSIGAMVGLAGPAYADADVDTNFADQLHRYNIYGPRDYNARLGRVSHMAGPGDACAEDGCGHGHGRRLSG